MLVIGREERSLYCHALNSCNVFPHARCCQWVVGWSLHCLSNSLQPMRLCCVHFGTGTFFSVGSLYGVYFFWESQHFFGPARFVAPASSPLNTDSPLSLFRQWPRLQCRLCYSRYDLLMYTEQLLSLSLSLSLSVFCCCCCWLNPLSLLSGHVYNVAYAVRDMIV